MFSLEPSNPHFIDSLDLLLKCIGAWALYEGYKRYKEDQNWKRNEIAIREIKEFTSDKQVLNTMYMLDWGERYIELFPDKPDYRDRFVKVNRHNLRLALQYHGLRRKHSIPYYNPGEVAIRDNFDHFLFYLERFEQCIKAGLIKQEELEPYLKYWITLIADSKENDVMGEDVRNALYHYIDKYEYVGAQKLFARFRKNIKPKTNIESTL